jgi:hypothetical protein
MKSMEAMEIRQSQKKIGGSSAQAISPVLDDEGYPISIDPFAERVTTFCVAAETRTTSAIDFF